MSLSASYSVEMCRRSSPNYAIPLPWSLLPLYLSVGVHLFYHEPKWTLPLTCLMSQWWEKYICCTSSRVMRVCPHYSTILNSFTAINPLPTQSSQPLTPSSHIFLFQKVMSWNCIIETCLSRQVSSGYKWHIRIFHVVPQDDYLFLLKDSSATFSYSSLVP